MPPNQILKPIGIPVQDRLDDLLVRAGWPGSLAARCPSSWYTVSLLLCLNHRWDPFPKGPAPCVETPKLRTKGARACILSYTNAERRWQVPDRFLFLPEAISP